MLAAGTLKRLAISAATLKSAVQVFAAPPPPPARKSSFVNHPFYRRPVAAAVGASSSSYCTPPLSIPVRNMADKLNLSEEEWRMKLTPEQFRVLRQNGTEYAGTGEYNKCKDKGIYRCAGCNAPLYTSETKFDSGCGWPAFFAAIPGALTYKEDKSHGMHRIEMRCAKCDGHLGHVFRGEGFKNPVDERHCVNSVCLKLDKEANPKDFKWESFGEKKKG